MDGTPDLRMIVVWGTAILTYALALLAVWHISRSIREIQFLKGFNRPIVPEVSIVGFVLFMTCVVCMQHHVNRVDGVTADGWKEQ